MLAPAGTSDAIVDKLDHDIGDVLRTPQLQEVLRLQGGEVSPGTPDEFA